MTSSRFPEENELRMATLVACCIAGRGISNLWEHWKCVGHHGMLLSFEHKQRQVGNTGNVLGTMECYFLLNISSAKLKDGWIACGLN